MAQIIDAIGIADNHMVAVVKNAGSLAKSHFDIEGNSNLLQSLKAPNTQIANMLFGGAKQNIEVQVPSNVIVFNSICNPDTSSNALKLLSDFMEQIALPVINHPAKVLETSRDSVSQKLSSIDGLIMPKCIKITPRSTKEVKQKITEEHFSFPFIFRTAGEQGSKNMTLVESMETLSESLECFAFTGDNTFYMIEFIDYRSQDEYYRKARYWVVGDKVIPRHLVIATSWNISYDIKNEMMYHKKELQEEEKLFMQGDHQDAIKKCLAVKDALGLDYFGIDCNINEEGEMLIFEATPCMALLEDKDFPYINTAIEKINKALQHLIDQKETKA
ncbi:MAG TPA: hypothetical protein EYH57_02680 [Sulfurovum sp.]|nr:hypothetical protein [Sulfurovum sp.]